MKTLIKHSRALAYPVLFAALATAAISNSLFEISSSIFLGLWILDVVAHRRFGQFRGAWAVLLGIYVLVNVASLIPAQFAYDSSKGAFRILRWALLTMAVTDIVDTEEKFLLGMNTILAVIVFVAVDALIQGATGIEILRHRSMTAFYGPTSRITGPFPHANDFSAYLCLAVFAFTAAFVASVRNRMRLVFISAGLVSVFACLVLTYSRGAWIAVVGALFLWAILRRSILPVCIAVAFVAGAYLQSPFLFQERMGSLTRLTGTVTERQILWGESIRMVREKPILGFGANTYSQNVGRFKDASHPTDRQYAHNGYLQIAAETGVLGLAAFLAVILYFFGKTMPVFFRHSAGVTTLSAQGLWLGILTFLIQSGTDTTLQSLLLSGLLWMWIGLSWSAYRLLTKAHVA